MKTLFIVTREASEFTDYQTLVEGGFATNQEAREKARQWAEAERAEIAGITVETGIEVREVPEGYRVDNGGDVNETFEVHEIDIPPTPVRTTIYTLATDERNEGTQSHVFATREERAAYIWEILTRQTLIYADAEAVREQFPDYFDQDKRPGIEEIEEYFLMGDWAEMDATFDADEITLDVIPD